MSNTDIHHYDLICIGSGSGGFSAAMAAKAEGLKNILLVEKRRVGYSLCTNEGCMPSKTLLASASVKRTFEESPNFGITASDLQVNWSTVQKRVRTLVEDDFFSARREAILNASVDIVEGSASFIDPHTIQVGDNRYTGEKIVIATGSTVDVPPLLGLKETGYITSDEALYLEHLPSSLIVIGSGYIALELGYLFHKVGVEIIMLVRSPRVLRRLDPDIGFELQDLLRREGMNILTETSLKSFARTEKGKEVHFVQGDEEKVVCAEEIMVNTGRRPTIDDLGLEKTGLLLGEKGEIKVNDYMQTNVPHIYAVGDVTGKAALVYAATMEGESCRVTRLRKARRQNELRLSLEHHFFSPGNWHRGSYRGGGKGTGIGCHNREDADGRYWQSRSNWRNRGLRKDDCRATFRSHRRSTYSRTPCDRYYADCAAAPLSQRHSF